jgi:uncharacterized protein (DUF302 family)
MKRLHINTALLTLVSIFLAVAARGGEKEDHPVNDIAYVAELEVGFDEAIERVTEALKAEGFGIITRIDLHTTFKEKIGEEIKPHTILGACNPKLAHKAVTAVPEASLMLPCNVTVESVDEERTVVRLVNARVMMATAGLEKHPAVRAVGEHADTGLRQVAEDLKKVQSDE